MTERLVVDGLTVERGGRPVVRALSLAARGGEVLGVFGPSGAGKSTVFRALAGEIPARGAVRLDGRPLDALPVWRRARAGLGYVPQGPSVLFDLSVRDNLATFARLSGSMEDPDAWAARVGLADRRDVRAGALSGGERRRLELARALLARPAALLCDEPFAGLNPAAIAPVAALLREAAAGGAAVVLTDHHLDEALGVCDHAALLLDGVVELTSSARDFAAHPLVRERYVGRGPA
ncbi:MAG: ATP-binding cassette domain-containing protein [Myxococcales bacterium]|nr:MAG: ATP-binding cassette domain-containing protein [Myxococcales bacterium]